MSSTENNHTIPSHAQKLIDFLSQRREKLSPLLILTHDYPDPDALAAAFSLNHLARQFFGIESRIAYGGVIGRRENQAMVHMLKIPVHKLRPTDLKKYRNVALVDTQPKFKNNPFPGNRRATIIIDQHRPTSEPSAELALIDQESGASCVIVAEALLAQSEPIPVKIATALAYGILSDTLGLYRVRRKDTVQTYLSVLHRCDMKSLAKIQNPPRSRKFFLTLSRAIDRAILHRRVMVSHLGFVENPDLVSQMAEFLLTYEAIHWSLCTGRYRKKLYVSLRTSRSNAQAGQILRDIFTNPKEAGGHGTIAGGSFQAAKDGSENVWRDAEQSLQLRLFKRLRRSTTADLQEPFKVSQKITT